MITNIESLREHLQSKPVRHSDFISMMTIIRIQIEIENSRSDYPILHLFCDWLLHSSISRSPIAIDVMLYFVDAIGKYDHTNSNSLIEFNNSIIDSFIHEMNKFFTQYDLTNHPVDKTVGGAFFLYLTNTLVNRELHLPDYNKLNSMYKHKHTTLADKCNVLFGSKSGVAPTNLKVHVENDKSLWWHFESSNGIILLVQITYLGRGFRAN